MKFLKLVAGTLLLGWSFLLGVGIVGATLLSDEEEQPPPEIAAVAYLIFGVPSLAGSAYCFWSVSQQRRQAQQAQAQQSANQLRRIFLQQLEASGGRLTVLQFSIVADIPGKDAREFLDARAQEFGAEFEVSDQGGITYIFPM